MVTPKQVRREERKDEDEKTIWARIAELIEHGRKPTKASMDELLAIGERKEREHKQGSMVVKKEKIDLTVTPAAIRLALNLKHALDEAARHDEPERLAWG